MPENAIGTPYFRVPDRSNLTVRSSSQVAAGMECDEELLVPRLVLFELGVSAQELLDGLMGTGPKPG
jgi:hypothetical protein